MSPEGSPQLGHVAGETAALRREPANLRRGSVYSEHHRPAAGRNAAAGGSVTTRQRGAPDRHELSRTTAQPSDG